MQEDIPVVFYEYNHDGIRYVGMTHNDDFIQHGYDDETFVPIRYLLLFLTKKELSEMMDLQDQDPKQFVYKIRGDLSTALTTIYNN